MKKIENAGKLFTALMVALGLVFITITPAPCATLKAGFADAWKAAKTEYEDLAEKKKPDRKGIFGIKLSIGIQKALRDVDAAVLEYNQNSTPGNIKIFEKKRKTFVARKNKYLKSLKKEIKKEADKSLRNALKYLRLSLKAIGSDVDSIQEQMKASSPMEGLDKANAKNIEKTLKKAEAFIKMCKSKKSPDKFNGGIQRAGRDVSAQLGYLQRLDKRAGFDDDYLDKLLLDLRRWAFWNPKNNVTDEDGLMRELKGFNKAIKDCKKWIKIRKKAGH